ncbi:YCF36, putative [Actinidia rufa]|uniref:YCF36, putative n=1 Tax=Actinidia rufa TaxID=165716 RepID=A0A7J0GZF7_9ERIC|nr:YCF36, putative [Actinidia rufa]
MATALLLRLPLPPTLFSLSSPPLTNPNPHHHRSRHKSIPKIPFASFRNGSIPPETQCPVPLDQQPINEYRALSSSFPFSWAAADLVEYCSRLFVTGASFALLVGLPVAFFGSAGHQYSEPVRPSLAAASSGLFVVTLAVVRMYLGWSYVGNRLLSATVECTLSLS